MYNFNSLKTGTQCNASPPCIRRRVSLTNLHSITQMHLTLRTWKSTTAGEKWSLRHRCVVMGWTSAHEPLLQAWILITQHPFLYLLTHGWDGGQASPGHLTALPLVCSPQFYLRLCHVLFWLVSSLSEWFSIYFKRVFFFLTLHPFNSFYNPWCFLVTFYLNATLISSEFTLKCLSPQQLDFVPCLCL